MAASAFARLHDDLTDPVTGLPRYASALVEIAHLARHQTGDRAIGIVSFAVRPSPSLYRLPPEAAQRLRASITGLLAQLVKEKDRLYSLAHWEWLAVLPDLPSSAPVLLFMLHLRGLFAEPLVGIDGSISLHTDCGGAVWPDDGLDAMHLVQSSRVARLATAAGGGEPALYDKSMEGNDAAHQELLADLKGALTNGQGLSLFLQPQIAMADRTCVGCEALLRWQRPGGEWIPPPQVLAAVEQLGLRGAFSRWLLQRAIQTHRSLLQAGIDIVLSINLSASDLLDAELPDLIAQSLATWDIPPASLLLELTETAMVEQTKQVMDALQTLRAMGLRLSIDDFGTGYAGMSYLQRLPVEEVKIDRCFITHIDESERDREIVRAIVRLAHRLKMRVVAEGVETPRAAAAVARLRCERAQGYLYAKPLPLEEFIAWWHDWARQRESERISGSARKRGRSRKPRSA